MDNKNSVSESDALNINASNNDHLYHPSGGDDREYTNYSSS